jgi:membrane associated rhomboid family serine protease
MFPLNDTEPNRYSLFPFMTVSLILVNLLIQGGEFIVSNNNPALFRLGIRVFGLIPSWILSQYGGGALSAVTSTFLHGGLWHLFSNMLALWVFGRRVEDAFGAWRYLVYYLTAGVMGGLTSTFIHFNSAVPSIGASGAIFGIMGAYLLLFPGGRIRTLVMLSVVPLFPRIRALWIILYLLALQIPPALNVLLHNSDYQIGYWAHLGGFFTAALIPLFLRPEAFHRFMNSMSI